MISYNAIEKRKEKERKKTKNKSKVTFISFLNFETFFGIF